MTTVVLVGLTIVLAVAAVYVGLLLVRRPRPSDPGPARRTVGDLVRLGAEPADVSGADLFTPTGLPVAAATPAAPPVDSEQASADVSRDGATDSRVEAYVGTMLARMSGATRVASLQEAVDVGDAPWQRAARMTGAEPGMGWDTAPTPVVPGPQRIPVVPVPQRTPVVPTPQPTPRATAASGPTAFGPAVQGATRRPAAEPAAPAVGSPAPVAPEPAGATTEPPVEAPPEPAPVAPPEPVAADPVAADPVPVEPIAVEPPADPEPAALSRPLSDPELTPLMGIPLVRPSAPAPEPIAVPAPAPRMSAARWGDDEVVSLLPTGGTVPAAIVIGSPQPVWLRVVRRDGEPVADAVVTVLDDRGREVDTTKTAADGGGELRAPHGGRYLLIAGAEGFQPRAVTLTVDDAPVEVALLLPGSASVAGTVGAAGRAVAGARVVARQEGEVVDEIVTGPDGGYRFDDLAEGLYTLTATDRRGTAVLPVHMDEGADLRLDLDLVPPGGAR
jgi:Carboxypeptidase regulatory-like domain